MLFFLFQEWHKDQKQKIQQPTTVVEEDDEYDEELVEDEEGFVSF